MLSIRRIHPSWCHNYPEFETAVLASWLNNDPISITGNHQMLTGIVANRNPVWMDQHWSDISNDFKSEPKRPTKVWFKLLHQHGSSCEWNHLLHNKTECSGSIVMETMAVSGKEPPETAAESWSAAIGRLLICSCCCRSQTWAVWCRPSAKEWNVWCHHHHDHRKNNETSSSTWSHSLWS